VGRGGLLQSLDVSWSPCRRSHPAGVSRRISQVRRAMLPSPLNREARPPGLKYFGATCAFTLVTARGLTHHPFDGLVGGLQSFGFPPPCHPSYGALALTPAGLTPAEHVSFLWTHGRVRVELSRPASYLPAAPGLCGTLGSSALEARPRSRVCDRAGERRAEAAAAGIQVSRGRHRHARPITAYGDGRAY
jgi:hypothetical protein